MGCAGGLRWRWGILQIAMVQYLVISRLGPLRWQIAHHQTGYRPLGDRWWNARHRLWRVYTGVVYGIIGASFLVSLSFFSFRLTPTRSHIAKWHNCVISQMLTVRPDEFNFSEFNNGYTAPQMNNFAEANHNFQPLQPNHAGAQGPSAPVQFQGAAGEKRKSEVMAAPAHPQAVNYEDTSRVAAEEDKRRRNTAASARFRIKKKQREQALEKSAKEMTEKVNSLEAKVSQLETENKWLKNLLVEKNEGNEDISALWKEFTKQASTKLKPESSTGPGTKTESR